MRQKGSDLLVCWLLSCNVFITFNFHRAKFRKLDWTDLQCKVLETVCRYSFAFISFLFEFKDIIVRKKKIDMNLELTFINIFIVFLSDDNGKYLRI
jgi:hypothetical protein